MPFIFVDAKPNSILHGMVRSTCTTIWDCFSACNPELSSLQQHCFSERQGFGRDGVDDLG
jgi:hypothetical protein